MKEDAEKALNRLNGTSLDGRIIRVTWAKPKPQVIESSWTIKKKSNIQKSYDNWSVGQEYPKCCVPSTFNPTVASLYSTPIQVLEYVCHQSGFGEPYYQVYQSVRSEILLFTSKVFIPYLPLWKNGFVSDGGFPSPFEAKCFAALKALKKIGIFDDDDYFPVDPFIPAVNHPPHSSITSIPHSCSPIDLNAIQESRQCRELVKSPSSCYNLWNFPKEEEIVASRKSESSSIYDLMAAAVCLANHELQACSSKQN